MNNGRFCKKKTPYFIHFLRQDATFYLLNTAPQWKKINGGNWLNVEAEIRGFAQHYQVWISPMISGDF